MLYFRFLLHWNRYLWYHYSQDWDSCESPVLPNPIGDLLNSDLVTAEATDEPTVIFMELPVEEVAVEEYIVAIKGSSQSATISITSLNCWLKAGWVHGFIPLMPISDPTMCMLQQKALFSRQGADLPVFFWADRIGTWWCPFVAHAFLLITVVKSDYSSYHVLPASLNQAGHSPLTSFISTHRNVSCVYVLQRCTSA